MRKAVALLSPILIVALTLAAFSQALSQTGNLPDLLAPVSASRQSSSVKVWDDGTAFVVGEVADDPLPCNQDGTCFLKLRLNDAEVQVVYSIGPTRFYPPSLQLQPLVLPQKFKKGDWIKAFGACNKTGRTVTISAVDSTHYFVLYASDPTPVGPFTEHFFNDVDKRVAEARRREFEQAQKSGRRETYKDQQLRYEFSYPATWRSPQTFPNAPWSIYYSDFSSDTVGYALLTLGYIPPGQQAKTGIDFCTAQPTNPRCESKRIGKVTAFIDWGDSSSKAAFIKIPLAKGGIVTFRLEPNNEKAKSLFLPILDTFKED